MGGGQEFFKLRRAKESDAGAGWTSGGRVGKPGPSPNLVESGVWGDELPEAPAAI